MKMKSIHSFFKAKQKKEKISMISCYEYWSAKLLEQSSVDCLLVGDSVAMVVYGHESTIHATIDMMVAHVEAVRRGAPRQFIVGDMPFGSTAKGKVYAFECASRLLKVGANAVKIEGVEGVEDIIRHLIISGIPVMGHLGLTPQAVHQLGGMKVQGREKLAADKILYDAKKLEEFGAFSIVLECVPSELATKISEELTIATIGIGAGSETDGQVLVLHDLLGVDASFYPKFLKKYSDASEQFLSSINRYVSEVNSGLFPQREHTFQ